MRKTLAIAATLLGALACGNENLAASPAIVFDDSEPVALQPAPLIAHLELRCEEPVAGGVVEATVRTAEFKTVDIGYVWRLDGELLKGGESSIAIPANARKGQVIGVTVAATDGKTNLVRTAEMELGNAPPTWLSLTLSPSKNIVPGTELLAQAEAIDSDGDIVSFEYQWYVNREPREPSFEPNFSTAGLRYGDRVSVTVRASDGEFHGDELEKSSGEIVIANRGPKIVSIPTAVGSDLRFRYQVQASDPDGERRFRYRLDQAPKGMTIDPTGEIAWDATRAKVGRHRVEVVVADLRGGEARQRFDLAVREDAPAAAPPAAAAD